LTIGNVWEDARGRKARELMEQYERREPKALRLIHKILTGAGISMDALRADALTKQLDNIERIDRLATIAENRRNASLREIDRHRAVLGETLRRSVQEIEDAEFKMIETTPAKGKKSGLTSDHKIKANRANARASTGPQTAPAELAPQETRFATYSAFRFAPMQRYQRRRKRLRREIAGPGCQRGNPKSSHAEPLKRRSIYAVCVTRGINSAATVRRLHLLGQRRYVR
jgi:hypothetical protein